jgi:hypothetical protein
LVGGISFLIIQLENSTPPKKIRPQEKEKFKKVITDILRNQNISSFARKITKKFNFK